MQLSAANSVTAVPRHLLHNNITRVSYIATIVFRSRLLACYFCTKIEKCIKRPSRDKMKYHCMAVAVTQIKHSLYIVTSKRGKSVFSYTKYHRFLYLRREPENGAIFIMLTVHVLISTTP